MPNPLLTSGIQSHQRMAQCCTSDFYFLLTNFVYTCYSNYFSYVLGFCFIKLKTDCDKSEVNGKKNHLNSPTNTFLLIEHQTVAPSTTLESRDSSDSQTLISSDLRCFSYLREIYILAIDIRFELLRMLGYKLLVVT